LRIDWAVSGWGWVLIAAVAVVAYVWTRHQYRRTEPPISDRLRLGLILLRCCALLSLLLAVAGPLFYRIEPRRRSGEIVIFVEDSGSMAIPDTGEGVTRWQRALRLAAVADSLLRARAPDLAVTTWRGNGEVPSRALASAAQTPIPPAAVGTDLLGVLKEIDARWADRPLRGVILLTDGNDTSMRQGGRPPVVTAVNSRLIAVGVGDPTGPADRFIQDLRYPDEAYQGDRVIVEVTVGQRLSGWPENPRLDLKLRSDERVVAQAEASVEGDDGASRVELSFTAAAQGLQVYEVEVSPFANERYLSNNKASLAINIRKERLRVLLLAGEPGWDTRFLAEAAEREGRLDLAVAYRGREGLVLADSTGPWSPPRNVAEWAQWDGVVLTGWASFLAELDWEGLPEAVQDGLGLAILVGENAMRSGSIHRGGRTLPPAPLWPLFPVQIQSAEFEPGEWLPRVAAAGMNHPLLAGVTHQVPPGEGLTSGRLPPLLGVVSAPLEADAVPLLFARPLRDRQEAQDLPLLVVRRHGQGRVAWFGGRRLWELAFWEPPLTRGGQDQHPVRRFLRNLLVWTATGEDDGGLTLAGHRTVFQEGERIRLEARWRELEGTAVPDQPLVLRVKPLASQGGYTERTYSMTAIAGATGSAEVILPPLPPGRYEVRPQTVAEPQISGRDDALVVVPHSLESTQVRQDGRFLRRMAAGMGGSYVAGHAPDAEDRLRRDIAELDLSGDTQLSRHQWDIWIGWPLLIGCVLFLTAEWIIRRRHSLL
jgi:hypothetical protein